MENNKINTAKARDLIRVMPFPTTVGAFVSLQERVTGRVLDEWEREFSKELVELANMSFEDGKAGREQFDLLDGAEDYFSRKGYSERLRREGVLYILHLMDAWVRIAYRKGKEAARYAN